MNEYDDMPPKAKKFRKTPSSPRTPRGKPVFHEDEYGASSLHLLRGIIKSLGGSPTNSAILAKPEIEAAPAPA